MRNVNNFNETDSNEYTAGKDSHAPTLANTVVKLMGQAEELKNTLDLYQIYHVPGYENIAKKLSKQLSNFLHDMDHL